jgi:NADPH:quinone reductase-like Zn-dependent oxidoreductase
VEVNMGTMRAVRIHDFGGPEVLQVDDIDRPEPNVGEVLIEVHAASINPVDYKIRSGAFPAFERSQLPVILGRDVSGMVVRCGKDVERLHAGDAVYALLDPVRGGYAEYVVAPAAICAGKPRSIDHVTAASVPLAGLTAWQALFEHGQLQAGQYVLIHGGAGGVGHFAIQFAKARGARVATTVAGASDSDFVRSLGADDIIDYKAEPFEARVHDVDLVLDLVGGETQKRSWSVLKAGGSLVSTLGQPPDREAHEHRARGVGFLVQPNAQQLSEIAQLIDEGKVRPIVRASFSLEQARTAQQRVEQEHGMGKVVLRVMPALS